MSGDQNLIHLYGLTAKAFGFRGRDRARDVEQGLRLAALDGRLPAAVTVEVAFEADPAPRHRGVRVAPHRRGLRVLADQPQERRPAPARPGLAAAHLGVAHSPPRSLGWQPPDDERTVARRTIAAVATTVLLAGATTVTTAATAATATTPAPGWQPRPATFAVHVTEDVPVTMSDGTVLRVNVYRPARADGSPVQRRFPVVLTQTPYNKSAPRLGFRNDYLVQRGYVQVVADVRGTGSSEGQWASFDEKEQRDGAELVRWAHSRKRPWSNGDVALWGVSYAAINQFLTARSDRRASGRCSSIVPAGDVYRDVASGGQVDSGFILSWLGLVTATGLVPPDVSTVSPDDALLTLLQHGQVRWTSRCPRSPTPSPGATRRTTGRSTG